MFNYRGNPTLTNVIFSGNRAHGYDDSDISFAPGNGGGLCNWEGNPTLTNVIFSGNQAGLGGGMCSRGSSPTLVNVTFKGDHALYVSRYWLTFGRGGGIFIEGGSSTLTNVTFSGNWAYDKGGGMYNYRGNPTLTNMTFSGNWANNEGGGIFNTEAAPTLVNCILWGNGGNEIGNFNSAPTVTYSDVGGSNGVYSGTGNVNADPQFMAPVTATAAPTTTGNYRLRLSSPAIDAGNTLSVTTPTDLDGKPRVSGPAVDMGAYEYPELPYHVYLPIVLRQ